MNFKKIFTTALVALSLFMLITGCSTDKKTDITNSETRIVEDIKGQVEIPLNPKRIVDLSGNSDILAILGIKVIGTANSDAYDYTKFPSYLETQLEGARILGYSFQDTMDIEAVIELVPDLIIISTVQEKMYEQLSKVAPTIMIELEQINWKEDIRTIAKIMDKEKEANEWITQYEMKAKTIGDEIKNRFNADSTYLAFLASSGQFFVFTEAGFGDVLYNDMGLKRPSGLPVQENISLPVVNYEGLAAIDTDYIFAIGTDEDLASLTKNNIWNGLKAVKNNNVVILPSSPYFNQGYSAIGREILVDEIKGMLENRDK